MTWMAIKIRSLCQRIETTDPRRRPDVAFRYIDIAGIDRDLKRISTTAEIMGADAPSRARQVVRANDVLVSTVRPNLNAVAMVPNDLDGEVASTGFCVLRATEQVLDPRFLFYFTRTRRFVNALLQHVRGANYPAVTDRNVLDVEIPWPAKSEQRRIVEILDQADALRQERRAADEKAQRILPALFYKLFGDPLKNVHGWEMVCLGDPRVANINPRAGNTSTADDTELSFVSMADVDEVWGRIVGKQTRPYVAVKKGFTPFQNGDVIFAKITPCMQNGKAAIANDLHNGRAFGSTEFHVLRPGPAATAEWLYGLVRLDAFRRQAMASFTGSAGQQRVPVDFLKGYRVPLPPMEVQRRFAIAVQTILAHAAATDQIRDGIDNLFYLLLHRAFTGELTAGWREANKDQLEAEMQEQLAALEQARAGKPRCSRKPRSTDAGDPAGNGRHAGTDMYNKAALVTYIVVKCHDSQRPNSLGRTKLAKLFYLVQRRAELSLTQQFARRAAGPLDDAIHKFLNLAKNQHWLALPKGTGNLKPVMPGDNPQPAIDHVRQRWADALPVMDEVLDTMKGWGWRALERWATVENAAQQLAAEGKPVTLAAIKGVIAADPAWRPKLDRPEFADSEIASTLTGLRKHGYLPAGAGTNP